jgi:hypothetical protein
MPRRADQTNSSTPLAGKYSKTDPSEAFAQAIEEGVKLGLAKKKQLDEKKK